MECVGAGFIAFVVLAIVVGALTMNYQRRRQHELALRTLARRRELHFEAADFFGHAVLRGYINDVGVVLDVISTKKKGKSSSYRTRVTARTRVAMPYRMELQREDTGTYVTRLLGGQDIQVGDELFDDLWRVRGSVPMDVQSLFEDPDARAACLELSNDPLNCVQPNQVVLHAAGLLHDVEAEELLERAAAIAQRLTAARLRPWRDASERRGLTMTLSHDEVVLTGDIEGLTVRVRGDLKEGFSIIRVRCPPGLPEGLQVRAGQGAELGDPILDRMVAVTAPDLDKVRPILLDERVHGDLLAVVHAYPKSVLTHEHIDLVLPWASSGALLERIDDAVRLGISLRAATRSRPRHGLVDRNRSKT